MGAKLPDYKQPLTGVVLSNGPEAIDLAEKAAEYYRNADHGYDAMVQSQGGRPKAWVRDGWEETMRKGFCEKRKELIDRLKDDNPTVRGRRYEDIYAQRADDMIGETLRDKYKRADGHSYRPEYDYKPEAMAQGCAR